MNAFAVLLDPVTRNNFCDCRLEATSLKHVNFSEELKNNILPSFMLHKGEHFFNSVHWLYITVLIESLLESVYENEVEHSPDDLRSKNYL